MGEELKSQSNIKIVLASIATLASAAVFVVAFALPQASATDRKEPVCKKSRRSAKPCPTPSPTPGLPVPIATPVATPIQPEIPTIPTLPDIPTPSVPGDQDGPEVPFPMSASLPFPWDKIEGLWNAKGEAVDLFFSFEVQIDRDGRQILNVTQLNANGVIVAQGVGLAIENDKLVRAAMTMTDKSGSYMLFIGSYQDPKTAEAPRARTPRKTVTVLTVRSFAEADGSDIQFTVSKVSKYPYSKEKPLPKPVQGN